MFGSSLFRKKPLDKMMVPDDLDELLQVNSAGSWLLFSAVTLVVAGLMAWGTLGTVSEQIEGFGIIKTVELPREVVAECDGQVDSIFCETGDPVSGGRKLLSILRLEDHSVTYVKSPCDGEVTGLNVREGSFVRTGHPLLLMMRAVDSANMEPEVVFFVPESEVTRLKPGMISEIRPNKPGLSGELLTARIVYIAEHPIPRAAMVRYFPDKELPKNAMQDDFHEVRAVPAFSRGAGMTMSLRDLQSLNGVSCNTVTVVSRSSPIGALMHGQGQ